MSYIEEVLNPGYGEDTPSAFRELDEDPTLTYDLSRMFWDGGSYSLNEESLCASIQKWNQVGLPTSLNSNSPALSTPANRKQEDTTTLVSDGISNNFEIFIPGTQFEGTDDSTHNDLGFVEGKSYTLTFYVNLNGRSTATFTFYQTSEANWSTLYGISFSSGTSTVTPDSGDEYKWHKVSTTITKDSAGSEDASKVILNISGIDLSLNSPVLLITGLKIMEAAS